MTRQQNNNQVTRWEGLDNDKTAHGTKHMTIHQTWRTHEHMASKHNHQPCAPTKQDNTYS